MKAVIVDADWRSAEMIEKTFLSLKKEDESAGGGIKKGVFCVAGTALNGKDGYELIKNERPDLIVMDLKLPKPGGISLLRKLRQENAEFHVLVLTDDTDFGHARQAIELGIDNYMLKPAKQAQLKKAIRQIRDKIENEKALEKAFTIENIFTGCLSGQFRPDRNFHQMTREKYGFTLEEPGEVFTVWLGGNYMAQRENARCVLENALSENGFSGCVLEVDIWRMIFAVIYKGIEKNRDFQIFKTHTAPLLAGSISGEMACLWADMDHSGDILDTLTELRRLREWNLLFDRGELIRPEDIDALDIVPLKYPAELETQVKKAAAAEDGEEIKRCYYRLYDIFRRGIYSPAEMKECLIRFSMSALDGYKTTHVIGSELRIQYCMQAITEAVTWAQIRAAMEEFLGLLREEVFREKGDEKLSPLIRQAIQMIRKYFDHGITLEETADRLFVSEEYLSSQFKKETGRGFTETVRYYRIGRIKDLLINTTLKLNQIAELTGYTDPKYMSRVFKEETGMLPNEFRKSAH